jgi:hypothetical protein
MQDLDLMLNLGGRTLDGSDVKEKQAKCIEICL